MGAAYVVCSAGLLLLFGKQAFWVFNRDPGVIACGLRIIRVTFPFYWIYVVLEVLAAAIRGAGRSMPPMLLILLNICVVRTVLLFVFTARRPVIEAVAATYPLAWLAAALCLLLYWRGGRWLPKPIDEVQYESV
jgi:Na+-driven multidrug efflux pump